MQKMDTRRRSKKKWIKVITTKRLSVFQSTETPNHYEVSWKRHGKGYGRRRYAAESVEEAVKRAPIVAGLEPDIPRMEGVTLDRAFQMALAESSRNAKGQADWLYQQTRFLEWLMKHYRDCTHWHLLTRAIIKRYLADVYSGKSANTRRLAIQPIVQTAGYMEREFMAPNVTRNLRIGSALAKTPPEVYLLDVVKFVDHLKEEHPRLEVGVALQGLAGLRLQEATRLTWDKVDLDQGLIEISGDVKTPWSKRVIPVAERVVEALSRAWAMRSDRQVQSISDAVLVSPTGYSYCDALKSYQNYSHDLKKIIRAWNPKLEWCPKDLRNCLPTFFAMTATAGDITEQYLGHAPRSVTARHYIPRLASASLGEGEALKQMMRIFRQNVANLIDRAVKEEALPEILNIFEREGSSEQEAESLEAV